MANIVLLHTFSNGNPASSAGFLQNLWRPTSATISLASAFGRLDHGNFGGSTIGMGVVRPFELAAAYKAGARAMQVYRPQDFADDASHPLVIPGAALTANPTPRDYVILFSWRITFYCSDYQDAQLDNGRISAWHNGTKTPMDASIFSSISTTGGLFPRDDQIRRPRVWCGHWLSSGSAALGPLEQTLTLRIWADPRKGGSSAYITVYSRHVRALVFSAR